MKKKPSNMMLLGLDTRNGLQMTGTLNSFV